MAYQSEAELELQFIDQLNKQGYSTVSVPDYDALVENFKTQFEAFNADKLDKPLTDKEWERILNLMLGKSVFQSAKILRDKFVLEREDGTKVYLSFFDSDHTKNIFQVTHQTTVVGKYVNRYDVTILVNGLPLIQVELKRRGVDIREAVNQVMRYKKHSYNGLYHFIQIFVVSNGVDTKYFANSDREMLHSLAFFWTDFDNVRITNLKDFSIAFLARDHIIKMLTRYMILNDTDKLLMVMRPYQVYAVEALVRQATLTNRNAYVWHTTGAGKTLTSFKTAQILAANPNIKKVIFLVDIVIADTAEDETAGKAVEIYNAQRKRIEAGLHTIPCRPISAYAPMYLGYYMNSVFYHSQLLSLLQGVKVLSISKANISKTVITSPQSKMEQEKISSILYLIDLKIKKQQQVIDTLKKYKRGLSDELFGKKETAEGWITVPFSEAFELLQNNTFSRNEMSIESGIAYNIHYGDVLIKYGTVVDLSKSKVPYIRLDVNLSKFAQSSYLRDGDIVIADTAEDYTVGKAVEIVGAIDAKALSGLHTIPCPGCPST